MDLMTQIYGLSAKMTTNDGFHTALLASISGKQAGYTAPTPRILAQRHVEAPYIPGNILVNVAPRRSGWGSSADQFTRMEGGIPEYAANMPSTLR
jgi:hypothetical protein